MQLISDRLNKAEPWFLLLFTVLCGGLLAGCNRSDVPGFVVKGKIVFETKPVFPGSIIFKADDGATLSGNLDSKGNFTIRGVQKTTYVAAIQTQKLANLGSRPAQAAAAEPKGSFASENSAADSTGSATDEKAPPKRREDHVPEKFLNSNVDIPGKYNSFSSSGLTFDFTDGAPDAPLKIELE